MRPDVLQNLIGEFNLAFGNDAVGFWSNPQVNRPIKGRSMSVEDIREIFVFTWDNMYNTINTKTLLVRSLYKTVTYIRNRLFRRTHILEIANFVQQLERKSGVKGSNQNINIKNLNCEQSPTLGFPG